MGLDVTKVLQFKLPESTTVQGKEIPTITEDEHGKLYRGFIDHEKGGDSYADLHYYVNKKKGEGLGYVNLIYSNLEGKDGFEYFIEVSPFAAKDPWVQSPKEIQGYHLEVSRGQQITSNVFIILDTTDRSLVSNLHDELFERLKSGSLEEAVKWLSNEPKYKSVIGEIRYTPEQ